MAASREQDMRLLEVVAARSKGASLSEISRAFGMPTSAATTQTNKVMDADLAHSTDETTETIKAAYWPRKE